MSAALRRAAFVISVSEELRGLALSAGVPEARTATIPNGVDGGIFKLMDRQEARTRLGMSTGVKHILAVGHRIRLKGHAAMVEATAAIRSSGIPAELWIIGDRGASEDTTPALQELAKRLNLGNALHLLGGAPQQTVAEYMNACDVFCMASTREGWPNVVSEAQSCGAPVVATRVGGVRDMIEDGRTGFIVEPGNTQQLRDGLLRALAQPWDRVQIANWGSRRTWRRVAEEVLAVFERIVTR
jgi:glycosyltransferase involved in cell wall biosynthesis